MNQFKHANWWRSYLGELSKDFGWLQAWISSGNTSTSKEKQRGKASKVKRSKEDSSCSLLSHFWSTSRSPFFTCYIPFQSSGSQESNASNRVRFGAEMRKIWPSEANCSRLCENFAFHKVLCEIRITFAYGSHNLCVLRILLCPLPTPL